MQDRDQQNKMRWIIFSVFIILFALTFILVARATFFGQSPASHEDQSLLVRGFLVEVAAAVVALFYQLFHTQRDKADNEDSRGKEPAEKYPTPIIEIYSRSQHHKFFATAENLISTSRNITLVATGLNLIWERNILESLIHAAKNRGARVTICMGNTGSPQVQSRLIEEQMGDNHPSMNAIGIDRYVRILVERIKSEEALENFDLLLFDNYPTIATLIFDSDIFVYPYGYQTLGNVSPMIHIRRDGGDIARFFLDNVERVLRDSSPAADVIAHRRDKRFVSPDWTLAAVYVIPRPENDFYKKASSIVGYDIRASKRVSSNSTLKDLKSYVGEAEQYGVHVTLADALLFTGEGQIERVKAELKHLSENYSPFFLSDLSIIQSPHDPHAIIVEASDLSGVVEALHHEIVSRVYPIAISSNYLGGNTTKVVPKDDRRSKLMLEMYGSPFILNSMIPHFTLLAQAPSDPHLNSQIVETLNGELSDELLNEIDINEIILVTKRSKTSHWTIEGSYTLCGPRGGD